MLARVEIDEPGLEFAGGEEEEEAGGEGRPGAGEAPRNFPPHIRFRPAVELPVRLYPGSRPPVFVDPETGQSYELPRWNGNPNYVVAPLGAERHARHARGVDIDRLRRIAVQVIAHSGLRWNAHRDGFLVADSTDEESGMLLVYDIRVPWNPVIIDGYLLGHGAQEVAVNERNGKIYQGNHADSPGVQPNIWVDVIDRSLANPYGFIDTGFYNAVQGIEVDEVQNIVFGATHVGEKLFVFEGNAHPVPNLKPTIVDYDPDPEVYVPFVEKASGENVIVMAIDLRRPFLSQVQNAQAMIDWVDAPVTDHRLLPAVLHTHDLTVDPLRGRVYLTLHAIQHAEHTGSPEEAALGAARQATEGDALRPRSVMGRWLVEVDGSIWLPAFGQVTYIDLSNGWDALQYPTAQDLPPGTPLAEQFVHAHWVAVDPLRRALFATGEHTGNLGVLDQPTRSLRQVLPISRRFPGATEVEEPRVHGVQVDWQTGAVYVSDEGGPGFYESVTVLNCGRNGRTDRSALAAAR